MSSRSAHYPRSLRARMKIRGRVAAWGIWHPTLSCRPRGQNISPPRDRRGATSGSPPGAAPPAWPPAASRFFLARSPPHRHACLPQGQPAAAAACRITRGWKRLWTVQQPATDLLSWNAGQNSSSAGAICCRVRPPRKDKRLTAFEPQRYAAGNEAGVAQVA